VSAESLTLCLTHLLLEAAYCSPTLV